MDWNLYVCFDLCVYLVNILNYEYKVSLSASSLEYNLLDFLGFYILVILCDIMCL